MKRPIEVVPMLHVSLAENTKTNIHGMAMQHPWFLKFLQCVTRQSMLWFFQTPSVVKTPQTKTKNSYCNVPAEQGDSKMQQKLSSHTVVAAKYGARCVALPKLEAKSQKYKLAAFFQGHNSSVETFQIRLSLGGSDRSSECSYTAPAHPPKPQPSWQCHLCGDGQSLTPIWWKWFLWLQFLKDGCLQSVRLFPACSYRRDTHSSTQKLCLYRTGWTFYRPPKYRLPAHS